MIPGSNILDMALSVIANQEVVYHKYLSRSTNSIGVLVPVYADPITLLGSFQPVPRVLYEKYGLDLQKSYFTFYVSRDIFDIQRDISSDRLVFNGSIYQCESANDWYATDGWKGMLCVLVNDPNARVFGLEEFNKNFNSGDFSAG